MNSLKKEVSLVSLVFQSVTHMAPGFSVVFAISASAVFAAGSMTLSVLIAAIAIFLLAFSVRQLARKYPSAGGFYTYGIKALGPRVGFLIGWCILLAENITPPIGLWAAAYAAQQILMLFNINTPFWIWVVLGTVFVCTFMYRGVAVSMKSGVVLGTIEILVFTILSFVFIGKGGSHNTFNVFLPSLAVHGWSGVFQGMIWAIFAFIGFEAVVPMAEEAQRPQFASRAVIWGPIVVGVFYLLTSYAVTIALGVNHAAQLNSDTWINLSSKISSVVEFIVLFAVMNSSLALVMSSASAATRVMYAMGRDKTLPSAFASVHPTFGTPTFAILFQAALSVIFTIIIGIWLGGPLNAIGWTGEIVTLLVIISYYIFGGAVSTLVVYSRDFKSERRIVPHIVIPVVAIILMLFPLYASVIPLPAYPLSLGPLIALIWIVVGILISFTSGINSKIHTMSSNESTQAEI